MNRWRCLLFILACLSQIGCAALLTEQEYVLIDRDVEEKATFHGAIYSLPERVNVSELVLLGSGKIRNIEFTCVIREIDGHPPKKYRAEFSFRLKSHLSSRQTLSKL